MIGGRATRWRRVVAAALPVLAIAANAAAQVIGPGHEREVIGLLAPAGLGGEIEPGWRVDGVSIDRDRITITLRHNDSTLIARLLPPGAPGDYRSAHFAIAIDPNGVDRAEAARVGAKLAETIARNDPPGRASVWTTIEPPRRPPPIGAIAVALLGVLVVLALRKLRARPTGWPEIAILAVGIGLRVAMAYRYDAGSGYDFPAHRDCIEWFAARLAWLPLGLSRESFHPPLYYALAGALVRLGTPIARLQLLSLGCGCARLVLLLLALEWFLPERRSARRLALALACALPASVHVDGMITNEALGGLLALAATALAIATFRAEGRARLPRALALGVVLALAVLVKVSALALVAAIALAAAIEWALARGSVVPRIAPLLVTAAALVAIDGPYVLHNVRAYGRPFVSSFDGPLRDEVARFDRVPYLRRRPPGYFVHFEPGALAMPYAPVGLEPRADLLTPLVASTFVDYYNYGLAPPPAPGAPSLLANRKPLRADALAPSRASAIAGAFIALVTVLAWPLAFAALVRRRDAGRLAALLLPLLALAGQAHFATAYPVDYEGPVKGAYMQFAAPPLCALYGLAIARAWDRRATRPLALVGALAIAAVFAYVSWCLLVPRV